jgi:hypothetical protein
MSEVKGKGVEVRCQRETRKQVWKEGNEETKLSINKDKE